METPFNETTDLASIRQQFLTRLHVQPLRLASSVTRAMTGRALPPIPRRNAASIMQQLNADLQKHGISIKQ